MAWIDCLGSGNSMGRSILMKGEHASPEQLGGKQQAHPLAIPQKRKLNVPIDFPGFVLNPLSIKAFNFFYYHKQLSRRAQRVVDYDTFFYPLDAIHNWNRIYGKRGFVQYQCVFPKAESKKGLQQVLARTARAGMGSFLAVLKLFGPQAGVMSFPMEGYTLALDFPVSRRLFPFLDELDDIVADLGGRVYLTKDARLKPEMLARMYPNLPRFQELLRSIDPEGRIRSLQSQRLGIHG
jgi:FAD/FMN-containing dehydrogenase